MSRALPPHSWKAWAPVDELVDSLRAAAVSRAHDALDGVVRTRVVADAQSMAELVDGVAREVQGLGPLALLAARHGVTDILVNGVHGVWIDGAEGLRREAVDIGDEASVRRLAVRLASSAGRRLDDASPWVDARLPNGMRLHAVLHPLARQGTTISLRVPAATPFSLADLEQRGMVTAAVALRLRSIVTEGAPFLLSGGTGTGKTTLLAALLAEVPADERIVIAEDSAELTVAHPHAVYLEGRPPNVEGAGAVHLRDLVRQALRMRPDRLIVGEVRGAEVIDLLSALNTGHAGGAATVHANSAADSLVRLQLLALQAGMPEAAARRAIRAAFAWVVHIYRDDHGVRRARMPRRVDALADL